LPKKRWRSLLNRAPVQAKNGHMTGIFFIMLNVLFWGLAPAIIKHGIGFVSPQAFLYYRFLIVIILTTPFLFLGRKKYGTIKTPGQLLQLLTIGFITNPLCLGLLFVGLHYTTSAAGAIIAGTSPLFIVVMSALFLKEKITQQ
jgi:drug/metabolite transporter (DMT)-like permease